MAHDTHTNEGDAMTSELRTVKDLPAEMVEYVKDVETYRTNYGAAHWWEAEPIRETPEPGDTWSFGDWKPATADDATHVLLRHTLYGDYITSNAVEVSNYRALLEAYPDTFIEVQGYPGAAQLMLALDFMPAEDPESDDTPAERLDWMIEDLSGLASYPVYDEEAMTELEMQWTDEAIESYLRSDMVLELARADREAESEILAAEDIDNVREHVWDFYRETGNEYPYAEAVETIVFPDSHAKTGEVSDLTSHVIGRILEAWAKVIEGEMTVNGQEPLA